jgi:hypothetical protein
MVLTIPYLIITPFRIPQQKAPGEPGLFAVERTFDYSATTLTNVCCSMPFLRNCTRPWAFANSV